MPAGLVVIGFDAMNAQLLARLAAEGKLPAITRLRERGLTGSIDGVQGYYVGSTWPSFYTGLNPAGHGFHRLVQLRSGTYEFFNPLSEPEFLGGVPFWRLASDAGQRVAIMDVPLARPEPEINGVSIAAWGAHNAIFGLTTTPSDLADDVTALIGEYPPPPNCDLHGSSATGFDQFIEQLALAVDRKTTLTLDMLDREDWDLLMQVYTESHCVGHQCWHVHDPTHPNHDQELRDRLGDPLESIYTKLDSALGRILDRTRDATVLLVAAHGMSYFRGADFLLSEILVRLGVSLRPEPARPATLSGRARLAVSRARMALPDPVKTIIRRWRTRLPGAPQRSAMPRLRFDLAASACFPVANARSISGIRLNLAGREPTGTLQPGAEVDSFCEALRRDLLDIIDLRTGEPLVADVYRTSSLYEGAQLDALPDLLVEWNPALPTGTTAYRDGAGATVRARSDKIGTIEGSNAYVRTGDHSPEGWFILAGSGIEPGELTEAVSVMDFHPTICRLLGLAEPEVDGTTISPVAGSDG